MVLLSNKTGKNIEENNVENNIKIKHTIQNRQKTKQKIIKQLKVGHTSKSGSTAPPPLVLLYSLENI